MKIIKKRWRELPIEDKLNIPINYFKIDKKDIEKIRNIKDGKQRLLKAAELQFKLFGEIHSYLTTWIAGYASDIVIRQKFKSFKNLRKKFIEPTITNKNINCSIQDLKKGIKIPEEMSEDLAEETGIHIGDGNLSFFQKSYSYSISGDLLNESEYHKNHIAKLIKKLYNAETKILEREEKNSITSLIKSKAIFEFKSKILKLSIGPKINIQIPRQILNNVEFGERCVAGIIDTDFSITSSLAINGKIHNSEILVKQMSTILNKNNIPHILKLYKDYGRFYINKQGALKIIKDWELHNPKHLTKLNVFEEFGKFIPYSTTKERLNLLEGNIDIERLQRICKKRVPVKDSG